MAAGNEKVLKELERFTDPTKVGNALFSLKQRVSSGELKLLAPKPQGTEATPEALKAWKAEQGLPPDVADYKFPLPPEVKAEDLPEEAKARIGKFTESFFNADLTQSQVDVIVGRYNEVQMAEAAAQASADAKNRDDTEDALRAAYGGDFKTTIATGKRFLEKTFGEAGYEAMVTARAADGRRLMDMPDVVKALNQLARENSFDGVETGEVTTGGKSVDQRLEEINHILATDRGKYFADKLDVEKQKLLERKEARAAR